MKIYNLLWTIFWLAASLLCLGLGIKNLYDEKAVFAKYEPATATVINWQISPPGGSMCPVYQYTTREGDTRTYLGEGCTSVPDPNTVGKLQEHIYYNPANPYSPVETMGWSGSEGSGLIAGFIGFVFCSLFWVIPWIYRLIRGARARARVN